MKLLLSGNKESFAFKGFIAFLLGLILQINTVFASLPKSVLTIAGGTFSGDYFKAGSIFCDLISEGGEGQIACVTKSTAGTFENINIILNDKTSLGIGQSDAITKHEKFSDLRMIGKLYNEAVFVVASKTSNLRFFDDILIQKSINIGEKNSGENFTTRLIMKAKGWSRSDFFEYGRYDVTSLICNNKLDVSFFVGFNPSVFISNNIMRKCDVRLITMEETFIEEFIKNNPEFSSITIPAETYRGQTSEIKTIGMETIIFVSKEMSEDLAYEITKTLFQNLQKLQNSNPIFKNMKIQKGLIPLHSGAEKFLKEAEQTQGSASKI